MAQTSYVGQGVAPSARKKSMTVALKSVLGRDWAAAYVFVFPTLFLLGGLIAYPFFNAVYLSFTNTVSLETGPFVGLRNYSILWEDRNFRQAVGNTVVYTVSSVFIKFWLGLVAALLIHRATRFRDLLAGAVLLPWIIPAVVIALTWRN